MRIILISLLVFLLNVPFGYWRANVKTLSWQWVLAVHLPVPIIIGIRIVSGIGFAWFTYLFLVSAFFLGQRVGSFFHSRYLAHYHHVSSCLVMDIKKVLRP